MSILYNIIWIIFAYLIGSINFSIILTKYNSNKQNIKTIGSGNAGATNAMRAYGFRFGFIIFILDTSKSYWLGFFLGLLQDRTDAFSTVIPQLSLLFVIIGHIFPIYFNFRGGKGAATLLGMIASISMFLAIIGAIIFIIIVSTTKYVSLGSIIVPYILAAISFICPLFNYVDTSIRFGEFWFNPLMLFIGAIIVALSHWKNMLRLINGNESKISITTTGNMRQNPNNFKDVNHVVESTVPITNDEKNEDIALYNEGEEKLNSTESLIDTATVLNKFD